MLTKPAKTLLLALALPATALAACGSRAPAQIAGVREGPGFDFTQPPFQGGGVQVDRVSDAAAAVNFKLYVPATLPKGLGDPTVYLSPNSEPPDVSAAYLVYQSETYGTVWVAESLPDVPDEKVRIDWYQAAVAPDALAEGEQGDIVTISDGVPALLRVHADGVAVMEWVENNTQFFILGSTITRSQALDLANSGWTLETT